MELHIEVELFPVVIQSKTVVHTDIFRPLLPTLIVKEGTQRHKQRIVIQPPVIFRNEALIVRVLGDVAALISLMQQLQAVGMHQVIVYPAGIFTKRCGIALLTGQHTLFDQRIQADKVGITGKSGIGLVGRIVGTAVAGGAQRQDLPVTLTGLLQPIHKIVGRLVKAANAIFGRKTTDGHQYTGISFHIMKLLSFIICLVFPGSKRSWVRLPLHRTEPCSPASGSWNHRRTATAMFPEVHDRILSVPYS